jgi:hypothetical protein
MQINFDFYNISVAAKSSILLSITKNSKYFTLKT